MQIYTHTDKDINIDLSYTKSECESSPMILPFFAQSIIDFLEFLHLNLQDLFPEVRDFCSLQF